MQPSGTPRPHVHSQELTGIKRTVRNHISPNTLISRDTSSYRRTGPPHAVKGQCNGDCRMPEPRIPSPSHDKHRRHARAAAADAHPLKRAGCGYNRTETKARATLRSTCPDPPIKGSACGLLNATATVSCYTSPHIHLLRRWDAPFCRAQLGSMQQS